MSRSFRRVTAEGSDGSEVGSRVRGPEFPAAGFYLTNSWKNDEWNYNDRRLMQEIVPGIYLGPLGAARDTASLDQHGVTTLVPVRTPQTSRVFRALYPDKYQYVPVDIVEGSLVRAMSQIKSFIDACLQRNEKILFYDETGNAKAAILICAYLMETQSLTYDDAYAQVSLRRLSVAFSDHELYQLREFGIIIGARDAIMSHPYSNQELTRSSVRRKYRDSDMNDDEIGPEGQDVA